MFADAVSVLSFPTVAATIVVGLFLGAVYLPEMRVRTFVGPLSMLVVGLVFFAFVTFARYIDAAPLWDRNMGTGVLWVIFCVAMWVGLRWALRKVRFP